MPKKKNKKGASAKASKWLYKFEIQKTSLEKVTESSKDADGKEITVTREEEVTRPVDCYILKPKRSTIDEAELFYGVELAKGVKAGLLTKSLISKRYSDDGGIFSKADQEAYSSLQLSLFQNEKELQKLELLDTVDKKEKEEKNRKAAEILFEMTEVRNQMQDFEMSREAVFDQTADTRARNKIVLWWIVHLSYMKDELKGGEIAPLFEGENFEQKLNAYDHYEELNIDHVNLAMKHFAYFISFWYNGQANTKEEFDKVKVFLDINLDSEKAAENEGREKEPLGKREAEKLAQATRDLKEIEEAEEAEEAEEKVLKEIEEPEEEPAEEPAEELAEEPAEELAEETEEESAEETKEETKEEPAEEPAEEPKEEPKEESSESHETE